MNEAGFTISENNKKTGKKFAFVVGVVFIFVLILFLVSFNNDKKEDTVKNVKHFLDIGYNFNGKDFIFLLQNELGKNISEVKVYVDGDSAGFELVKGEIPIQSGQGIKFRINRNLCDKEHLITIDYGYSQKKITTFSYQCPR